MDIKDWMSCKKNRFCLDKNLKNYTLKLFTIEKMQIFHHNKKNHAMIKKKILSINKFINHINKSILEEGKNIFNKRIFISLIYNKYVSN